MQLIFNLFVILVISNTLHITTSCFPSEKDIVYITSYHAKWFEDMLLVNRHYGERFNRTILEKFPVNKLIIYHEEDVPSIDGACMVDLRTIPWLENELSDKNSGLNQYYEIAEYLDPTWNGGIGAVKMGHSLFFKVLSIYHAVQNSPEGSVVFWVDTDVSFREDLPGDVFQWIRKKDIVYIPFVINFHVLNANMPSNGFDYFDLTSAEGQSEALLQEFWRIETGLFAFTVSNKTQVKTPLPLF